MEALLVVALIGSALWAILSNFTTKAPEPTFFKDAEAETKQLHRFQTAKKKYMASQAWKDKRQALFLERGRQCEICGSDTNLHVHHTKDYKLIPYEPLSSLVILCDKHHLEEHKNHGFPKTFQEYMKWDAPLAK